MNPVAHIIELCTLVYPQKYGKPDPNARGMTGPKNANGETTWGGLAEEVRYWGNWVLEKVKAEIERPLSAHPRPRQQGREAVRQTPKCGSASEGNCPARAILSARRLLVDTDRPMQKSFVRGDCSPLVRQTWLCKKKDRYAALRMIAPKGEERVRFEGASRAARRKAWASTRQAFSKGGNATCPFCGTVADMRLREG